MPSPFPGMDPFIEGQPGYDYAVDYGLDVAPYLSEAEKKWVAGLLANKTS